MPFALARTHTHTEAGMPNRSRGNGERGNRNRINRVQCACAIRPSRSGRMYSHFVVLFTEIPNSTHLESETLHMRRQIRILKSKRTRFRA